MNINLPNKLFELPRAIKVDASMKTCRLLQDFRPSSTLHPIFRINSEGVLEAFNARIHALLNPLAFFTLLLFVDNLLKPHIGSWFRRNQFHKN